MLEENALLHLPLQSFLGGKELGELVLLVVLGVDVHVSSIGCLKPQITIETFN